MCGQDSLIAVGAFCTLVSWMDRTKQDRGMTPMNPERDFRDHLRTYRGFVRGLSWTVAGFAAVLIVLAIWLL